MFFQSLITVKKTKTTKYDVRLNYFTGKLISTLKKRKNYVENKTINLVKSDPFKWFQTTLPNFKCFRHSFLVTQNQFCDIHRSVNFFLSGRNQFCAIHRYAGFFNLAETSFVTFIGK